MKNVKFSKNMPKTKNLTNTNKINTPSSIITPSESEKHIIFKDKNNKEIKRFKLDALRSPINPDALSYSTYYSNLVNAPQLPPSIDLRNNLRVSGSL